ncbi:MAG: ATP-binding protein, partial [Acidimicrobiales bacterium]
MGESGRGRPSGTVSFLFTDIEGSTPLWERHPRAMGDALVRHDQILRAAIDGSGGFVFSTAGDAFSAAFWSPAEAVGAAVEAQRQLRAEPWPDDAPLRVRMAVHLGVVHARDGNYFGSAVNRAARLMGLAHGGQVLVSLVVEEAVRDELPAGVGLRPLGEHRLRGLSRPETVFQVTGPGLPDGFAPLAVATAVQGNLPSPPTSFVGRVEETKLLAAEIRSHRLVTLVGPGGVGKTRLSIEAAGAVADEFPDGVWFVELAPVADPGAVLSAVASTLSVSPQADVGLLASIVAALTGRRALVVLDNCEHVIEAAAEVAAGLGRGAASVSVLASSREALGLAGERVWDVATLDAGLEAVELFCERAGELDRAFAPSDADLAVIAGICESLDGMPLAVELAASRVRQMSLAQLAERLADRFRVLRGSVRGGAVERHQTLRAAVEWSYRLLGDQERVLFDRLSVFAGGFDAGAAEAVCGGDPLDELEVFDLLGSLVDKSLVVVDRESGRYRLLETLRQFGESRLAEDRELAGVRNRHACHFAEQVQSWWGVWNTPDQRRALDWVEVELANLRGAFRWAVDSHEVAMASAIAAHAAMMTIWLLQLEPASWAEEILDAAVAADVTQTPRLYTAASLMVFAGRTEEGRRLAERGLALEADGRYDPFELGWTAMFRHASHLYGGDPERSLEITTELIGQPGLANVMGRVQTLAVASSLGRDVTGEVDQVVAIARRHGHPFWICQAMSGAGRAFAVADPARARRLLRDALTYAEAQRLQ